MYVLYTKDNCAFCTKAKLLLQQRGLEYQCVDVMDDANKQAMFDRIAGSGAAAPRTVPQIFNGELYIGGFTELREYLGAGV